MRRVAGGNGGPQTGAAGCGRNGGAQTSAAGCGRNGGIGSGGDGEKALIRIPRGAGWVRLGRQTFGRSASAT